MVLTHHCGHALGAVTTCSSCGEPVLARDVRPTPRARRPLEDVGDHFDARYVSRQAEGLGLGLAAVRVVEDRLGEQVAVFLGRDDLARA